MPASSERLKSAREPGQHQCGVSNPEKVSAPGGDDPADVCREKRDLSVLRGADGASDTLEGFADDEVAGRGRRVGEARGLMDLGDRGKPASDGARCQGGGTVCNVEGNGFRRRGKRRQLMRAAPGLEVAPVISISLECGGGLGRGNEGLRLLDQFLETGWFRGKGIHLRLHGFPFKKTQVCGVPRGAE